MITANAIAAPPMIHFFRAQTEGAGLAGIGNVPGTVRCAKVPGGAVIGTVAASGTVEASGTVAGSVEGIVAGALT